MNTHSPSEPKKFSRIRGWLNPLTTFNGVVATLLLIVVALGLWAGITGRSARESETAQNPTARTVPDNNVVQDRESASGPVAASDSRDPAIAAETQFSHHGFIPLVTQPEFRNPQTGVLRTARGIVEVQESDGAWVAAHTGSSFTAGQRIRTGELSSVRLGFYDGSEAYLGPNTEVSIDALDARREEGPRVIEMTQWLGETSHEVAKVDTPGSNYAVHTPTADGVAKGTSFDVLVTSTLFTYFSVEEGAVNVTGVNVTVLVTAGQITTVDEGEPPSEPVFSISGEGEVSQTGDTWIIAGQSFETHEDTIIIGDPQVGDIVSVHGRLLPDDTRVADWIMLLHHAPQDTFSLTGIVGQINDATWTIAGQTIVVSDTTTIEGDIEVGDLAHAEGTILEEGTLAAEHIRLAEEEPGLPFSFSGVVQSIADDTWTISSIEVAIDEETTIAEGLLAGDLVAVDGWILEDDTWLASSIQPAPETPDFEFTGVVENMDPWMVSGIAFETREWTEIDAEIAVGDQVKVSGTIMEDGTWVATEIELFTEEGLYLEFVGTVDSMDPWIVNGFPLVVDENTLIEDEITEGDVVKVEALILPDGTWLAVEIELVEVLEEGQGCMTLTAVVVGINGDQIELNNWPAISIGDYEIEGDIQVGTVIAIVACTADDGTITIINIIIIFQPLPTPPPPPPDDGGNEGGTVTICHKPGKINRTMTLPQSALNGHLGHGDTMGPCN